MGVGVGVGVVIGGPNTKTHDKSLLIFKFKLEPESITRY